MATNAKKEKWVSEEDQKFIKRKALYKKAGLTNVFKNRTKTLEEIRSRIRYLEDVTEWTQKQLERPQWKIEMEEMKLWLKEFEKKVNKDYKPSEIEQMKRKRSGSSLKKFMKEKYWKY